MGHGWFNSSVLNRKKLISNHHKRILELFQSEAEVKQKSSLDRIFDKIQKVNLITGRESTKCQINIFRVTPVQSQQGAQKILEGFPLKVQLLA